MRNAALALIFMLLPFSLAAQEGNRDFPEYTSTLINDFADLIPQATENRIIASLEQLLADKGVEMTLVTLRTRNDFGPHGSLERFATGLFNNWGVGDADRDDGILVLVLRDDREMRIELGAGYGRDFDWAAQQVIDEQMLPRFRDGDYALGIEAGVNATIRNIAMPKAEGHAPVSRGISSDSMGRIIFWTFLIGIGALLARTFIGDALARLKPCPNCGRRTLRRSRETLQAASKAAAGRGLRTTRCSNCDYRDETSYSISRVSSKSSSGSFGGGSSSGGGASGKW